MERLFRPRSIAVVGASPKGGYGSGVLAGNRDLGFDGNLYVVHPREAEVGGVKAYRSLSELPEAPDAVSVALPARLVSAVVQEAVDLGAGGAVVYASGFGELGDEGVALQDELVAICGDTMPLIGPNCLGAVSYRARASLWAGGLLSGRVDSSGLVALAAQSGNIALTSMASHRMPPLAYSVSMGNQAVSDVTDCVQYFLSDDQVKIVALIIEGLADFGRFRALALDAAAKNVAIVALKIGGSERGEAATLAHTGTLAGSDGAYDALFRQTGVVRVADLEELILVTTLLAGPYEMKGRSAGMFASSGGECGLMADLSEANGVGLPELSPKTEQTLRTILPEYGYVTNPFDLTAGGWGQEEAYYTATTALAQNPGIDFVAFVGDAPGQTGHIAEYGWPEMISGAARASHETETPVVLLSTITEVDPGLSEMCRKRGVVHLPGSLQAMRAIGLVADRYDRVRGITTSGYAQASANTRPAALAADGESGVLTERAAKSVLKTYGIASPAGGFGATPEAAVAVAASIGYPVVAKLEADGLAHKSDIGGVIVGIPDAESLLAAATQLVNRGHEAVGQAAVRGVYVEQMQDLAHGVEVIIGGSNGVAGPLVVVGAGGLLTELLGDAGTLLWPFDESDVERVLSSLRIDSLLRGYRGTKAVDRGALTQAVIQTGRLLQEHPEIAEVDVNPILCRYESGGVIALDALITLRSITPLKR